MTVSAYSYSEALPDRCDYYVFANDSVLWTGYSIGRRIGVLADNPCYVYNVGHFPADGAASVFHCTGRMDVSSVLEEQGTISVSVMGSGRAVICLGDTIDNAVLTRQECRWVALPDSAEIEPHERIIYRWYAPGAFVPFAIQENGELYVDSTADTIDTIENDAAPDRINEAIDRAVIEVDGDMVTVSLEYNLYLTAYIMDSAGNIYNSTSGHGNEFVLSTSGLMPRQYLIALSADQGTQYVRKFIFTKF